MAKISKETPKPVPRKKPRADIIASKTTRGEYLGSHHIATSVRFEPLVKAAIDKAAKDDTRSTSSLIQKVMTEWLKGKGYLK